MTKGGLIIKEVDDILSFCFCAVNFDLENILSIILIVLQIALIVYRFVVKVKNNTLSNEDINEFENKLYDLEEKLERKKEN